MVPLDGHLGQGTGKMCVQKWKNEEDVQNAQDEDEELGWYRERMKLNLKWGRRGRLQTEEAAQWLPLCSEFKTRNICNDVTDLTFFRGILKEDFKKDSWKLKIRINYNLTVKEAKLMSVILLYLRPGQPKLD